MLYEIVMATVETIFETKAKGFWELFKKIVKKKDKLEGKV